MRKFWDITLGLFLILYIIFINTISTAKIAFSIPIFILGVIFVFYHFIKNKIKKNKILFNLFRILKILIVIGSIFFIVIEYEIISYPKHNNSKADYIIVLGAGLSNGTTPSLILQGRLDAAIEYAKENNESYIVLSGGQGSDEKLPESYAMKKYLQDRGVDEKRIIVEDKSRNTNENFKFSKKKIEEHSKKSLNQVWIKIITTDFHALRSSILARKNGYVHFNNYSSSTVWYLIPVTYTREAFAIVKSILFD